MIKRELSIEKEIEMLEVVRESEGILFISPESIAEHVKLLLENQGLHLEEWQYEDTDQIGFRFKEMYFSILFEKKGYMYRIIFTFL